MQNNRNTSIKLYYDKYCKMLNKEIISAKKMAYDNYCIKMRDKMKSTCNIINTETGRTRKQNDTQYPMGKSCVQNAAETINKYFLSLADKLAVSISSSFGSPADRDFFIVYGTGNKI
jgi:hypothetical protein